jgi:hypothetical protein
MGRIEHPLLDGDKPPIRPKTAARNHTIPQKSNKRIFSLRQDAGRGVVIPRPANGGAVSARGVPAPVTTVS